MFAVFPLDVSMTRHPASLRWVPRTGSPTSQVLPGCSDFLPLVPPHFVFLTLGGTFRHGLICSPAVLRAAPRGPGFVCPVTLPGVLRKETAGSPRFPGNPCTLALLYDPGRPAVSRRYRYSRCCHPIQITSLALQTRDFVAQLHSSRTRCLRLAAGLPFPAQDSLCGLLARLWPCGAFTHWVSFSSFKKASDSSFPLDPGLAWRNI